MCNLNGCSAICHGLGEHQSLRSGRADVVHASLPEATERSALVGGDGPSVTSAQKKQDDIQSSKESVKRVAASVPVEGQL